MGEPGDALQAGLVGSVIPRLTQTGDGRQQAKSRLPERARLYNGTIRDPGSCRSARLRA